MGRSSEIDRERALLRAFERLARASTRGEVTAIAIDALDAIGATDPGLGSSGDPSIAIRALGDGDGDGAEWIASLATHVAAAIDRARAFDAQARTEAACAFVEEAGAALARHDDARAVLDACAALLAPRVADECAVDAIDGDAAPMLVADVDARGHALPPDVDATAARLGARSAAVAHARGVRVALFTRDARRLGETELAIAGAIAARAADAIHRARLAGEARHARHVRDVFLSAASHELRGPLAAIAMWAHVVGLDGTDAATRARGVRAIEESVAAQSRLVDDLLDLSRALSGKLRIDASPIAIGDALREAVRAATPAADAKGVAIGIEANVDATVRGDGARLAQAIGHVLARAIDRSPRDGRVDVTVGRVPRGVRIEVRDRGEAFAGEALPDALAASAEGASVIVAGAIGAEMARRIVALHGGAIVVVREPAGATFAIDLPASVDAAGEASRDVRALLRGARILVVDDDDAVREAIVTVLAHYGATVREARSVRDAIARVDEEVPDLVVSDVAMPEEDGCAMIRRLRARPADRGGAVLAVALSAHGGSVPRERAIEAGFDRVLAKPLDAGGLALAIHELLRSRPR